MQNVGREAEREASRVCCATGISWRHPKHEASYAWLDLPAGTQVMVEEEVMDYQERRVVLGFYWTWPLRRADIAKLLRQMGQLAMSIVLGHAGG